MPKKKIERDDLILGAMVVGSGLMAYEGMSILLSLKGRGGGGGAESYISTAVDYVKEHGLASAILHNAKPITPRTQAEKDAYNRAAQKENQEWYAPFFKYIYLNFKMVNNNL